MPLLRRRSSKENTHDTERRTNNSGTSDSLFDRLSRRRSSSSNRHAENPSHDGSQPSKPVNPEADHPLPHREAPPATSSTIPPQPSLPSPSHPPSRSASASASTTLQDASSSSPAHVQGGLTKDDVAHLFSGAPHFMLERGRRGRFFPQAYFPWNNQLDITDLQDRVYLKHESYALATLHAHLPVPDEVNWKPGMPHPHETPSQAPPSETSKRPMFDLGIYERPNMMGITGVEIGTIAFRAYLERPVSDGLHQHPEREYGQDNDGVQPQSPSSEASLVEHMSASEALKVLAHSEGEAKVGKHAPKQDRIALIKGGGKVWKNVGVRDVKMDVIADRLCHIGALRDQIVSKGWRYTVLDVFSEEQMGEFLFSELLYPPGKIVDGKSGKRDLKVQVEALVKVLTTPGVWRDFSLPRERLVFVETLYATRREDQLRLDADGVAQRDKRRWSLVQLVLAIELTIRLDAALRLGVAMKELSLAPGEIHHFNKLRNLKVDWDLVVARRFLDLCYAKKMPINRTVEETTGELKTPPQTPLHEKHHLFDRLKHSLSFTGDDDKEEGYILAILPRQPKVMGEGLIRFGTHLNWPTIDSIHDSLKSKLAVPLEQMEEMLAKGIEPLSHRHIASHDFDMKSCVELRPASKDTVGGPLSHAWLGGLIIPGFMTCELLMCALLENDTEGRALEKLGAKAWPRAGFVLGGRSWWSKACVVGLVMAPSEGSVERMGYVGLPEAATPISGETGEGFGDGWVLVEVHEPKSTRKGYRILDGDELSKESSPLGIGHGKMSGSEFRMVTDHVFDGLKPLDVRNVQLVMNEAEEKASPGDKQKHSAAVLADIAEQGGEKTQTVFVPIIHDIRFVAGYPCRPPHGHAAAPAEHGEHRHPVHKHLEHLPAHPLHESYRYVVKSVAEVLELEATDWLPDPTDKQASSVWIIDARGEPRVEERGEKEGDVAPAPRPGQGGQGGRREILMRAWCAKVGKDAIVSRVGRQCVSCVVREARALEIGIVIRIGDVWK